MIKHERPFGSPFMMGWAGLPSLKKPAHFRKNVGLAMSVTTLTTPLYSRGGGADGSIIRFAETELANRTYVEPVARSLIASHLAQLRTMA